MTTFQAHEDMAVSHILVAPVPANSGVSWSVDAGEGSYFPTGPFDVWVFPGSPAEAPTRVNAEIGICTTRVGDAFTVVTRAAYGTTARTIVVGDLVVAGISKNHIVTIEQAINAAEAAIAGLQPTGNYITALTGDVTAAGPGSVAGTIAADAVTNAKLADMPTLTLKGNNTGGSANPLDLTVAQVNTMLGASGGPSFGVITGNSGTATADAATDTVAITGTGVISTAAGDNPETLVITSAALTGDVTTVGAAATIPNNTVTNAKAADMAGHTIKGNNTAGSADPIDLTLAQVSTELNLSGTNTGDQNLFLTVTGDTGSAVADTTTDTIAITGTGQASTTAASTPDSLVIAVPLLSGDVTSVAGGAATIPNNTVTNAKAADMATQTFKGRITAGTGDPEDLTIAQAKTLLNLTGTNSGDQTITLTGDVTGSGTGSFAATIAALAVSTGKIADDAVTFAKMQNIATDSLVGRDTAASGDPETILLNGTLSMDGSGNLQRAALTGDVTATAGSNATTIAADAVTNAKLADMPTLTLKGNNTGGTANPLDLTVAQVNTMLGGGGASFGVVTGNTGTATADVGADTIAITGTGVISTAAGDNPETLVITSAALTGDVTTSGAAATIANDAVTNAKAANMAQSTIKGRQAGGGTGDPEDLTVAQLLTILVDGGAAWTNYTPTLTQGGTVTKTVTYASYVKIGRTVIAKGFLSITGSGTAATIINIGLPPFNNANSQLFGTIGSVLLTDQSLNTTYAGIAGPTGSATDFSGISAGGGVSGYLGQTGGAFALALASGDTIAFNIMYEATS